MERRSDGAGEEAVPDQVRWGAGRCLLAWLAMLAVSIANGALRDFAYGKSFSELHAHQLSTVSGIILLGVVIWLFARRRPFASAREALSVGLFWMMLTVAFEFLFFHYVGGHSWSELLANYDLSRGRLWPLVLVWVLLAPWVFYRSSRRQDGRMG